MTGHARQDRHLDPSAAGSPVHLLPGLGTRPGTVTVVIGGSGRWHPARAAAGLGDGQHAAALLRRPRHRHRPVPGRRARRRLAAPVR